MNRRHFINLSATTIALCGAGCAEENDSWPSKEKLRELFRKNGEFFRSYNPEKFKDLPVEIEDDKWIGDREEADESGQPYLLIKNPLKDGEVYNFIQVAKDGSLLAGGAHVLRVTPQKHDIPQWDIATVIERAMDGLKRFGWEVPPEMQLAHVQYTLDGRWLLIWYPTYGGVPEVKNDIAMDEINVILEHDGEGVRFSRNRRGPAPAHTVPKLTRTEGLVLATKALPKIMATGLYTSWMPEGLSPTELKQFDLCVTVPNWILDPGGHPRSTDANIAERRLCWRAVFMLLKQVPITLKNGEQQDQSILGLLHVFVDAVTGEIAGGNMEPVANDVVSRKYGN